MNKDELKTKIKNILEILNRSDDLPCGSHYSTNGKIVDVCFDKITNQGRTCMLRGRNIAIKRLNELLTEV